jgi:osmotically-inducible protein OsmY
MGSPQNIATATGVSNRHAAGDDIRAAVENALRANPDVDAVEIDIAVEAGCVHLAGKVGSYAERTEAEQIASEIPGVTAVDNGIRVRPHGANWAISDDQIAESIGRVLAEIRSIDVSTVEFDVSCHVATLNGSVRSAADRADVRHAVELLPGVDFVRNLIEVPDVD